MGYIDYLQAFWTAKIHLFIPMTTSLMLLESHIVMIGLPAPTMECFLCDVRQADLMPIMSRLGIEEPFTSAFSAHPCFTMMRFYLVRQNARFTFRIAIC